MSAPKFVLTFLLFIIYLKCVCVYITTRKEQTKTKTKIEPLFLHDSRNMENAETS